MNEEITNEKTDENLLSADIPEKFKDPETGEVKVDLLARSYRELEQRLSQMPRAPKTHEEYCIACDHGMFEPDDEINKRLHKHDFTPEQAQIVYDLAAEKMMPMIRDVAADFKAEQEVEKLINHFGGAEQWKEISRQLLAYGQKNLPADVLDNLSSSYEGVVALHRMMKGGEPKLSRNSATIRGGSNEAELSSMMRDPKYWREKDPAFVAKVTEGFASLYKK